MRHVRSWVASLLFIATASVAAWLLLQWPLGRVDPLFAVPWLAVAALAAVRVAGRLHRPLIWLSATAASFAAVQWALAETLAGEDPVSQILVSAGCAALALGLMLAKRWRQPETGPRKWAWRAARVTGAVAWIFGPFALLASGYAPQVPAPKPRVTMMTSLPIVWSNAKNVAEALAAKTPVDPAFAILDQYTRLSPVDSLTDAQLAQTDVLFLAHPRAMAPADLVRVDIWVRGGGRALILADGLSGWEPPFALGDSRNPPITSLLTPLLDHWGIGLAAPSDAAPLMVQTRTSRVRLHSPGRFDHIPPKCLDRADAIILQCRLGKGEAILVADADLLSENLWRDGGQGDVWRDRSADNMAWILDQFDDLAKAKIASTLFAPVWAQ